MARCVRRRAWLGSGHHSVWPRLTALLLVSALTWLAPVTAGAQSAIIAGIVRGTDGEPINGATVLARTAPSDRPDRTTQTTTNESGRFGFIGLRAGRWIFTIQRLGFEPTETRATIRRTGRINVSVILEFDPFNPPAPVTGSLAGIRAVDSQIDLAAAHALFDQHDFDGAIDALCGDARAGPPTDQSQPADWARLSRETGPRACTCSISGRPSRLARRPRGRRRD